MVQRICPVLGFFDLSQYICHIAGAKMYEVRNIYINYISL